MDRKNEKPIDAKELILEIFPVLSPRMQEATRFVIDHLNKVVVSSMRAVAERAGDDLFGLARSEGGVRGGPGVLAGTIRPAGQEPCQA